MQQPHGCNGQYGYTNTMGNMVDEPHASYGSIPPSSFQMHYPMMHQPANLSNMPITATPQGYSAYGYRYSSGFGNVANEDHSSDMGQNGLHFNDGYYQARQDSFVRNGRSLGIAVCFFSRSFASLFFPSIYSRLVFIVLCQCSV